MDLSGKVALVTGALRRIGRETSRQIAEDGVRIAVHFKGNEEAAPETLAPHNVFVYAVAPGFVETEMAELVLSSEGDAVRRESPLGRVARPDEVARALLFLASGGTDFMTGCILDVNGASYLRS